MMDSKLFRQRTMCVFALMAMLFLLSCSSNAGSKQEIAVTTQSDAARQHFNQGLEIFEKARFNDAREHFSKAIEADPDFALAYYYRSITSTSTADFEEHIQKAFELKDKVSDGERLLIEAGYANTVENNPQKAIGLLVQLVEKYPDDKRAYQTLGTTYYFEDEDKKAIVALQSAIELDPDYSTAYNMLGYAYRETGDNVAAEKAFQNYLRILPDEPNPHDSIADLYSKMGRHEDAIAHYKKAVELDPTFALSQRNIGSNLVFLAKYDEAREAYKKASELATTSGGKLNALARTARSYVYEGNLNEALNATDAVLEMAADVNRPEWEAGVHANRCDVYIEMGDLDQAEESVSECRRVVMASDLMQSAKDNFAKGALFDEGLIACKRKDFDTATAKADELKAMVEAGNDPTEIEQYHALMGHIYLAQSEPVTAIEHFGQADQEDPYTLYHAAVAYQESGDDEKATELFGKVAHWNEPGLGYALVRSKAMMQVEGMMSAK